MGACEGRYRTVAEVEPKKPPSTLFRLVSPCAVCSEMDFAEGGIVAKLRSGVKGHWSYRTIAWLMKEKLPHGIPCSARGNAGDSPDDAGCVDAVTGDQPVMHQHQHQIDTALWRRLGTAGEAGVWVRTVEAAGERTLAITFALNVTHLLRGGLPMPGGQCPMRYGNCRHRRGGGLACSDSEQHPDNCI